MVATISCEKEKVIENKPFTQVEKSDIDSGMPGAILLMEIDNNNQFYFVTKKTLSSLAWDSVRNAYYYPTRYYLSRKTDEIGEFEILDTNFFADKIIFDKNNNLWGINYKVLFLRNNNTCDTIIKLGVDGRFTHLVVDEDNNIWISGYNTGLYKVDSFLNITKFTTENSELTTNSITNLHIDKNNILWGALLPNSILKIAGSNWTIYNRPMAMFQTIWALVTDKNSDLWIGMGYEEPTQTLVRFNGEIWETKNPRNDKDEMVFGTASLLFSDAERLYVFVELRGDIFSGQLLTFDGVNWNLISGFPEPTPTAFPISDLIVDSHRQVLWITTHFEGIYKLDL
ncbi:MAG: hypothetical protein ACYDEX_24910 [Mobilitalea sp.]